jgi:uncharacterized protein YutE (UPF0331/DUF86 family)/predicted nucleotidyltransferase
MTEETATLVAKLREVLRDRQDVHLALLFGSQARGKARPDSDVDVAVLGEDLNVFDLYRDLSLAVHKEVDVVDLSRAGFALLNAIARDHIVIHQGRPGAAGRWLSRTITQLETDRPETIVTAMLREMSKRMDRVRTHLPSEASVLEKDRDALDLVSFNLMISVQSCLKLASYLVSDEGWPPADHTEEAFQRLSEHGVISKETAAALVSAVEMRDAVAHGYAGVVPRKMYDAAVNGIGDLERFSREVSAWVTRGVFPS